MFRILYLDEWAYSFVKSMYKSWHDELFLPLEILEYNWNLYLFDNVLNEHGFSSDYS